MEREIEFLRHRCEYLERMLETCLERISSAEARVADLERRPVAVALPDEPRGPHGGGSGTEADLLLAHGIKVWENVRGRR